MQNQGFLAKPNHSPASFGLAFAITGAGLAALLLATPYIKTLTHPDPTIVISVPLPTPVDPKPVSPVSHQQNKAMIDRPVEKPPVAPPNGSTDLTGAGDTGIVTGVGAGDIFRPGPIVIQDPPPVPMPVLTEARYDMRYAASQQPPYPAAQQREEVEGSVTVRVRIGTDGRVLAVEQVSATNAAFFASTRDWALRKWRFKPATRDGVAVESWRTMSVRFNID
jgi:periplasmic protein TonB